MLGYGIYSGGFRINLARFFRITGAVLVLVAAGLVTSAFHSAHEAGWIDAGQRQVADLTWLVRPGSVQSSLLTGMLGWQPRPTVIEVVVYVAFLVPVMTFVLWPATRPFPRRALTSPRRPTLGVAAIAAVVLVVVKPDQPAAPTAAAIATDAGTLTVTVVEHRGDQVTFRVSGPGADAATEFVATADGTDEVAGRDADVFRSEPVETDAGDQQVTLAQVAELNGGRLPLGVNASSDPGPVTLHTSTRNTATLWLDADDRRSSRCGGRHRDALGGRPVGGVSAPGLRRADHGCRHRRRTRRPKPRRRRRGARGRSGRRGRHLVDDSLAIAVLSLLALAVLVLLGRAAPKPHGRPPTHEPAPPRGPGGDLHTTPVPR